MRIYKHFLSFLQKKGINVDVQFPPIDSYNSFERLMFIAKYLQDERHKKSDIADRLWVSEQTINADIRKLLGEDDDPIQICGKVFSIDEVEHSRGQVHFSSTAHPLFLTENLSQIIVTLKGLKTMAENPLYTEYAKLTAANIWEQLSDYAKMRIRFVLSKLLPEDLSWYESLRKDDGCSFRTEVRCSQGNNILDCIKNGKFFFVEYSESCPPSPESSSGSSEWLHPFSWRLTENGSCKSVKFYLLPLSQQRKKGKDQNIQKQTTSEHFSWRFLP